MPHLSRAVAILRIVGPDLDPEEVSALLGSSPSHSEIEGQTVSSLHGLAPRIARHGVWRLEASATEPEDFDLQVEQLLEDLTKDVEIWRALQHATKLTSFVAGS
jgi:hypothetical protein